jgi:hypothetical protein
MTTAKLGPGDIAPIAQIEAIDSHAEISIHFPLTMPFITFIERFTKSLDA